MVRAYKFADSRVNLVSPGFALAVYATSARSPKLRRQLSILAIYSPSVALLSCCNTDNSSHIIHKIVGLKIFTVIYIGSKFKCAHLTIFSLFSPPFFSLVSCGSSFANTVRCTTSTTHTHRKWEKKHLLSSIQLLHKSFMKNYYV